MRRALLVAVLGLAVGLSGCGDDGGGRPSPTSEASTTTTTPPSVSPRVDAFCQAVDEYVAVIEEALEDPTSVDERLRQAADAYAETSIGLAGLTPEEQVRFDECRVRALDALEELGAL